MTYSEDYQEDFEQEEKTILGLPLKAVIGIVAFGAIILIISYFMMNSNKITTEKAISYLVDEGYITYAFDQNFDLSNYKLVNLADGVNEDDAINKGQLDTETTRIDTAIDDLDSKVDNTSDELESLQVVWTSVNEDIDSLKSQVNIIAGNNTALNNSIDNIHNDIISIGESIVSLDERLVIVEENMSNLIAIPEDCQEGDILAYIGGVWSRIAHEDIMGWINGTSPS